MSDNTNKAMTCRQAQLTMALCMERDPGLTDSKRQAFEAHLDACSICAQAYEESKDVVGLVKQQWQVSEETRELVRRAGHNALEQQQPSGFASADDAWRDFCERRPDFQDMPSTIKLPAAPSSRQAVEPQSYDTAAKCVSTPKAVLRWVIGIAACLLIGLFSWLILGDSRGLKQLESVDTPFLAASPEASSAKIELLSQAGRKLVASGTSIQTQSEIKRLVLNDKHHLALNANTLLSIKPITQVDRIGCLVNLGFGEICAGVEHDGNPFVVHTPHSRSVITGTTFGINVKDKSTTLTVSEGSVRFESTQGVAVQVTAGKQSVIATIGVPSQPVQCQAEELMAWAQPSTAGPFSGPELDKYVGRLPLPVSYPGRPTHLKSLDYDQWIEAEREWFKAQFPWIFRILNELATSNQQPATDLDYPELLIQTGDIWQIVYPDRFYRQIAVFQKDNLVKITNAYQLESIQLDRIIAQAASSRRGAISQLFFGESALHQWLTLARKVERACDSVGGINPLCEYSMVASQYLENTRILAWLCVENGTLLVTSAKREALLDLLEKQITSAYQAGQAAWHLSKKECNSTGAQIRRLVTSIEAIRENEKKMASYRLRLSGK